MAINIGLTLFLPALVLVTVNCTISQEHLSTENINEILDKLILQTHKNGTGSNTEIKDLTPVAETQSGNDSNIYYFKTFAKPHINFKSSNENLHGTRHTNKTVHSFGVSSEDHHATSEDESFQGTSKITRKSVTRVDNRKHFMNRHLHEGQESLHSEFKSRSGDVHENNYSLEDLLKNEIASASNTNNSTQITITQHDHPNQQFNLLHEYPEIIIDHVTYDNDDNGKNSRKPFHDSQNMKKAEKEGDNEVQTFPPTRKIRYNIPEEDIESSNSANYDYELPEQIETRNYFTPEVKGVIDAIIQKKVIRDALLKQTTDNGSRKQSMVLENIAQRLPESRQMTNNAIPSYSVHRERIAPTAIDTLAQLRGPKSYSNVPLVPSKWEAYNRLLRMLIRMCRHDVPKRTRHGLINRLMPNIEYRPMYYEMYKK